MWFLLENWRIIYKGWVEFMYGIGWVYNGLYLIRVIILLNIVCCYKEI